jgi:hypothetical protein
MLKKKKSLSVVGLSHLRTDYQAGEMTEPTVCETRWKVIVASFEKSHEDLTARNPGCLEETELLRSGLQQ